MPSELAECLQASVVDEYEIVEKERSAFVKSLVDKWIPKPEEKNDEALKTALGDSGYSGNLLALRTAIQKKSSPAHEIRGKFKELEPMFRKGWEKWAHQKEMDGLAKAQSEFDELQKLHADFLRNKYTAINKAKDKSPAEKDKDPVWQTYKPIQDSLDKLEKEKTKVETKQKEITALAKSLEIRCEHIFKDAAEADGPHPLRKALNAVTKEIQSKNFIQAQFPISELQNLLDAEEAGLKASNPRRDEFFQKLKICQEAVEKIKQEIHDEGLNLALSAYKNQLDGPWPPAISFAKKRKYDEAIQAIPNPGELDNQAKDQIRQQTTARDAYQTELDAARDEILKYEELLDSHKEQGLPEYTDEAKKLEELNRMALQCEDVAETGAFAVAQTKVRNELIPKVAESLDIASKVVGFTINRSPSRERAPKLTVEEKRRKVFEAIKINLPIITQNQPWNGAMGGNITEHVDPKDSKLWDMIKNEFSGKEVSGHASKPYPGKTASTKVCYYVTRGSKSGAAYDISGHIWVNGKDTLQTVFVFHLEKL